MADPVVRAVNRGLRFEGHITGVSFDFDPSIAIVAKDIDHLGAQFEDFREVLALAVRKVMIPSFEKNFADEGRPSSWAPLAAYIVKVRGTAHPILNQSGALKDAATSFEIWSFNATTATIRSLPGDVWYGYLHQAGFGGFGNRINQARTKLGKGAKEKDVRALAFKLSESGSKRGQSINIPARPFILLQEEDEGDIADIFYVWLGVKVKEAGF